jgi:hypothetical protein
MFPPEGTKKCQSVVGSVRWAISLGRFDANTAAMTMSSFRPALIEGHLEQSKMMHGAVRFGSDMHYCSDLPEASMCNWDHAVCWKVAEVVCRTTT